MNVRATDGWTFLHCAAANGNENIVNLLIQNNANVNDRVLSKTYPARAISFLAQSNADICGKIPSDKGPVFRDYSFTSLHFSALNGHCNIVNILIENGADPLLYEKIGNLNTPKANLTPLDLAAANDHYDIVKLFIENGTNPLLKNKEGKISRAYAKDKNIIDLLKKAENKYLYNQIIKVGVVCGGIAAVAVTIGCIAVNIELATAIILAAATFVMGTCIVGSVTYFVNKPSSKLNEASLIPIVQSERAPSS